MHNEQPSASGRGDGWASLKWQAHRASRRILEDRREDYAAWHI